MVLTVIIAVTLFRLLYYLNHDFSSHHDWSQNIRKVVIYRIDSIYYGFLGAFVSINYTQIWKHLKRWFLAFGILLFFGMHILIFVFDLQPENSPLFYSVFYLPLLSISLLCFFPFCSNIINAPFLRKQISFISILSYGLYLVNYSLVLLTIQYFIDIEQVSTLTKFIILIMYWVMSFVLAYLLYIYFEKPIMNIRDTKFFKEKFI